MNNNWQNKNNNKNDDFGFKYSDPPEAVPPKPLSEAEEKEMFRTKKILKRLGIATAIATVIGLAIGFAGVVLTIKNVSDQYDWLMITGFAMAGLSPIVIMLVGCCVAFIPPKLKEQYKSTVLIYPVGSQSYKKAKRWFVFTAFLIVYMIITIVMTSVFGPMQEVHQIFFILFILSLSALLAPFAVAIIYAIVISVGSKNKNSKAKHKKR